MGINIVWKTPLNNRKTLIVVKTCRPGCGMRERGRAGRCVGGTFSSDWLLALINENQPATPTTTLLLPFIHNTNLQPFINISLQVQLLYNGESYLKTGVLLFRKNHRDGRQSRKTAVSRRFSAYLLDCLVCFSTFILLKKTTKILANPRDGRTTENALQFANNRHIFRKYIKLQNKSSLPAIWDLGLCVSRCQQQNYKDLTRIQALRWFHI